MSTWAQSAEQRRRDRFAYWVTEQRLAEWTVRAVVTRAVLASAALAAVIGAALTGPMLPWWAWLIAVIPFAGAYLAGRTGYYVMTGRLPREPLARWASTVAERTQGDMKVNVSGFAELAGAGCLAVLGPWVMSSARAEYRLVAVIAAAGWLASFASAIMVDPAWYNPGVSSWPPWEFVRSVFGVIASIALAAVVLPAPWPASARLAAAVACAAVATIQIRINETDRMLRLGSVYSGQRDIDGRRTVTTALHTLVGNPLIHLKRQAAAAGPDFFDLVRQVEGGYRETLALDRGIDVTMDWPGVLGSRLDAIAGQYGINVSFSPPPQPMTLPDREVARFVLDDLTENAAKAGAASVDVALTLDSARYHAVVSDDGPGFRTGTWQRSGGGLQRLQLLLESRQGSLDQSRYDGTTSITARWQAATRDGQEKAP